MIAVACHLLHQHIRFAWRLLVLEVLLAWLIPYGFVWFVQLRSGGSGGVLEPNESREFLICYLTIGLCGGFGSTGLILSLLGAKNGRTLPVPSWQMAGGYLLLGVLNLAALFFVTLCGYRVLFAVAWPVFATVCWACGWFCLIAGCVFWLSDSRLLRIVLVAGLLALAGYWMNHRLAMEESLWQQNRWDDIVFLAVSFVVAYFMVWEAYSRFRRDELIRGRLLTTLFRADTLLDKRLHRHRRQTLDSDMEALAWLEGHRAIPSKLVVTLLICVMVTAVMTFMMTSGQIFGAVLLTIVLAAFVSAAANGVMGNDLIDPVKRTMKHHFSLAPMSTTTLVRVFRKTIIHNVMVSIVVAVACCAASCIFSVMYHQSAEHLVLEKHQWLAFDSMGPLFFVGLLAFGLAVALLCGGLAFTSALVGTVDPVRIMLYTYGSMGAAILVMGTQGFPAAHSMAWVGLTILFACFAAKVLLNLWQSVLRGFVSLHVASLAGGFACALGLCVSWIVPGEIFVRIIAGLAATWIAIPYGGLPLAVDAFRHR